MSRITPVSWVFALCVLASNASAQVVINEIDYDQPGGDAAEFLELYNPGPGSVDLTGYTLEFINGSNGSTYDTIVLPTVTLAADDYYVVCANATTVANCDLDDGPDTNFLQNGAPDGVALRDAGATLVDSVSYEGDIAGIVEGSGTGLTDDGGAGNDNLGISRIPNGNDTDVNNVDFQFVDITPGGPNGGPPAPPAIVINEIDYDQPGADAAEFIELYNPGPGGADLTGYTLEFINGSGGGAVIYDSIALPSVTLAADDYFVVCANAATVANCDLDDAPDTNFIQNGAPDAVALRDGAAALVDSVSYEGDVPGIVEGSGVGLVDFGSGGNDDLGISRIPNGTDTDVNNADFQFIPITPGAVNAAPPSSALVINEVDYDQPGADTAEFVEIYNPGPAAVDLSGHTLAFINGSNGSAYDTIALPNVTLAVDDYFVVCANAATVANCDLDDAPDTNFIQNGAPDAIVLRDAGAALLDAVSYEGDVAGFVEGSGAGLIDNGGAGNDDLGISRIPNGTDTDVNNVDFQFFAITPGSANEAVNTAPVAQDDIINTDEDTAVIGSVLADNGNGVDSDAEMDMLTVVEVNGSAANVGTEILFPGGGGLTINANGNLTFETNGDFESLAAGETATLMATYTISDGMETDTANVDINVSGVDDAPIAVPDTASVLEDAAATTIDVLTNDMDVDMGPRMITSTTQPANGTVSIAADMLTVDYTPDPEACNDGAPTDDFSYTLNGGSSTTVSVTVTCINDAPAFTVGPNQVVNDDAGPQTINAWATGISAGPANESGQALTFNITGNTNPGVLAAGPAIDAAGTLTFTPAPGTDGSTDITVSLSDDGGTANGGVDTSAEQTFSISVSATTADLELTIANNAPSTPNFGDQYEYTLNLLNNGPAVATNSSVLITLPDQVVLLGAPACAMDNGDGTLTWNAGDLAVSASAQCVFSVEVTQLGDIVLSASASSDLADPDPSNSTNVTNAIASAALPVPTMNALGLLLMLMMVMVIAHRRMTATV